MIKCLKAGDLKINSTQKQLEIAEGQLIYPYDKIKDWEWGYVYEKYVGQVLESEGFKVTYNGFSGFVDGGIDLIAEKGNSVTYVQCKYSQTKKLCKSHIDQILYKASKKLLQSYEGSEKQLAFSLIVHSKENNFTRRAPKSFKLNFSQTDKLEFPWLMYFLEHNHIQNKIKVGFREIPMCT